MGLKLENTQTVPTGWKVKKIIEIAPLQRGFDLPNRLVKDGSVPVVYSNGVEKYHNQAMVKGPGVITGRSGTLGSVHYVFSDYWPHNTALWVTDFKGNHPKFIYYLYTATHFERFASGSGVPTLNRNDAHSFELIIPDDPKEQYTIVTILSDMDTLLENLDRLITKKRDIKQAAMQQLLTGQTRLSGFKGTWKEIPLIQIADIRSGGTPSTKNPEFWNGGIAWCTPTDITALCGRKYLSKTNRTISYAGLRASSAEVIPPNSIIMTTRATIGECAINTVPMTTNQGFKNLIPSTADVEFLYYLMTTKKDRLTQFCGGSTFLEIGKKQLENFEVMLPLDSEEQHAIATILSDMDAEIEALEQRRAKTAALKQGMMQELLTGRTRLVEPQLDEVVHA